MNRREIARAKSVGEFLSALMPNFGPDGLSYSEFGRRTGMRSRSHPRDVVLGKKRLSLAGANQVCRGLKLPPDLRAFFLALVESERSSSSVVAEELKKARRLVQKRAASTERDSREFFSLGDASLIYAALGSIEDGTDLASISHKTGIKHDRVIIILDHLAAKKIVCQKHGRYFATDRHLSFGEIKSGGSFQKHYDARIVKLRKRAGSHFNSENELFWEATLSVRAGDLPRFKEELRTLLSRFVEDIEAGEGETLRSVTLGFFDPR